jgi:hypothetical protein
MMAAPPAPAAPLDGAALDVLRRFAVDPPPRGADLDRWPYGERLLAGQLLCDGYIVVDLYSVYHLTRKGAAQLPAGPVPVASPGDPVKIELGDEEGRPIGSAVVTPVHKYRPPELVSHAGRTFRHMGQDHTGQMPRYVRVPVIECEDFRPKEDD